MEDKEDISGTIGRYSIEESRKKSLIKINSNVYHIAKKELNDLDKKLSDTLTGEERAYTLLTIKKAKESMKKLIEERIKKISSLAILYSLHPSPSDTTDINNMADEERELYYSIKNLLNTYVSNNFDYLYNTTKRNDTIKQKTKEIHEEEHILVRALEDIGDIAWLNNETYRIYREDLLYLPLPLANELQKNKKIEVMKI
jgi:DNA replication initiation complex subunit (GINS family)